MVNYESFYNGANYGLDSAYGIRGEVISGAYGGYRIPAGQIGFPTDPTTANQLQKVSEKLSTGTKVIEVSGLGIASGGGPLAHLEKIPKQHFEEIRRLKELAKVDLTFHGPLVEATGISRQGWDESQRKEAERQMTTAVKRAHELDPKGNIIVTFHASNLPIELESKTYNEETKKEETSQMFFVDEREGRFVPIGPTKKDYFKKDPTTSIIEEAKKQSEEGWATELQHVNFNAYQGYESVKRALSEKNGVSEKGKEVFLNFYKDYLKNPATAEKNLNQLEESEKREIRDKMSEITHGDIYLRESYIKFKNLFNQAYETLEKDRKKSEKADEQFRMLEDYRKKIIPIVKNIEQDPSKLVELGEEITTGINVLRKIDAPQRLTPLRDFALEKASETFAGVALSSYKQFKDSSPIISIENPPVGSGLSTGEDLRDLVKKSRDKFAEMAVDKLGMSESAAKKQAEKLIGVTWDVGHINMLRGHGYQEKHILEQTEKVAPYVKHVHLSDNFGTEHTELPMGMGNVPTKKHLELIEQYNKQVKKIVETGDWFSRQGGLGMVKTPTDISFSTFGSPIYSMKLAPYWNQVSGLTGAYHSGLGPTLPDIHFQQVYGAGFSGLPTEFGGQMMGRSRFSGAPTE